MTICSLISRTWYIAFQDLEQLINPIAYGGGGGGIFIPHHHSISCHSETT